jgi:hypothetical protein
VSVLTVLLVPQGILMAADRNITLRIRSDIGGGSELHEVAYLQRVKVHEWADGSAIIGYMGLARIDGQATDRWLYRFIGRNFPIDSIEKVAKRLVQDLNAEVPPDHAREEPLIIHLAGFERNAERSPVIWFIRNTGRLFPDGRYEVIGRFEASEELRHVQPSGDRRFSGMSPAQIRQKVFDDARRWMPFWFRQGADLIVLNQIDIGVRSTMQALVEFHPAKPHPFPDTLPEWANHLRFAVLSSAAYYEAFHRPYRQAVGGGADVVWVPWPEEHGPAPTKRTPIGGILNPALPPGAVPAPLPERD